ncbi:hypothetical protein [Thermoplasma volcanium GSS1]|uniref:DUF763 domain-containing protein n=1 Tax=Thermoplasma volcanium (strain ATCC 51530 / DSM 4299 / JCM 9571 / NBRC 15438 / GSS1) TaxID=273116 RepID=Q97BH6_THEVO|nr:DUF763 domain-containing protein [Thermoplasma volcanium]BAB59621.1 hypothetical protein [Thermoplasma volcanium GSS1]
MERKGTSILPLHYGHPPEYLYCRAVKLSGLLSELVIENYGVEELIRRIADPFWFHSMSLAIGFDWNSSGTTVFALSALKDYFSKRPGEIVICGGKGKKMGSMQDELESARALGFITASESNKLSVDAKRVAKIDNNLLQDGFDIYLQFLVVSSKGTHAVVQQGMNTQLRSARRYHWTLGNTFAGIDGRNGISSELVLDRTLDLSAKESEGNRKGIVDVIREKSFLNVPGEKQATLDGFVMPELRMDYRINWNKVRNLYEYNVDDFEQVYMAPGIGKSTIRALSFLAEIVYGEKPSFKDPVKYSFALGGKDGVPKPVNVYDYDKAIEFYQDVLKHIEIGDQSRKNLVKLLARMSAEASRIK